MPNKSKIVGEMETRVRELCSQGHNPTHIGKLVGLSKDTVKAFAAKHGYELAHKVEAKFVESEPKIVEMLRAGANRKSIQKLFKVHYTAVKAIADKHGIEIRGRAAAALDKILPADEVLRRSPPGTKFISFENQKYQLQAPDGTIYWKTSAKIKQGSPIGKSGTRSDLTKLKMDLLEIGYAMVDGTFNKKRKAIKAIHVKCGVERENKYTNFFVQDCSTCNNIGVSKEEKSLKGWIESLGLTTMKFKFKERITKPKEIDILIPSLMIGIEYCGLYDHTEDARHPRPNGYHLNKMLNAELEGIRLLTVYSNEWRERNFQVKSFLKSILGKNTQVLNGRDCEIHEIDKDLGIEFMKTYHIQGTGHSIFYVGIFHNHALVGAMSFGRHHRSPVSGQIVLSRMAFKADVSVRGGASKLLAWSAKRLMQDGFSSIITWSDSRWSQGNVYGKMGFTKLETYPPSYDYVKGSKLFSKQSLKLTESDKVSGLTESELRKSQGYAKIWDCGKIAWIKNLI